MLAGPLPELSPHLVWAAHALGIATGRFSIATLIDRHGRRMQRLVDALRATGLVDGDDTWRGPATAVAPPASGWGRLVDVIVEDRPVEEGERSAHPGYLQALAAWASAPAAQLADRLATRVLPPGDIVDLGGAHGVYGQVVAARLARASVLVDRDEVIAALDSDAKRVKQLDRIVAADLLVDALPIGAAVTLLCNVLHLYDLPTARRLLLRAVAALSPGGLVVVRELVVDPDRRGPRRSVLFALNMVVTTRGGDVYPEAEYVALLAACGLEAIEVWPIEDEPESRFFVGRRP